MSCSFWVSGFLCFDEKLCFCLLCNMFKFRSSEIKSVMMFFSCCQHVWFGVHFVNKDFLLQIYKFHLFTHLCNGSRFLYQFL